MSVLLEFNRVQAIYNYLLKASPEERITYFYSFLGRDYPRLAPYNDEALSNLLNQALEDLRPGHFPCENSQQQKAWKILISFFCQPLSLENVSLFYQQLREQFPGQSFDELKQIIAPLVGAVKRKKLSTDFNRKACYLSCAIERAVFLDESCAVELLRPFFSDLPFDLDSVQELSIRLDFDSYAESLVEKMRESVSTTLARIPQSTLTLKKIFLEFLQDQLLEYADKNYSQWTEIEKKDFARLRFFYTEVAIRDFSNSLEKVESAVACFEGVESEHLLRKLSEKLKQYQEKLSKSQEIQSLYSMLFGLESENSSLTSVSSTPSARASLSPSIGSDGEISSVSMSIRSSSSAIGEEVSSTPRSLIERECLSAPRSTGSLRDSVCMLFFNKDLMRQCRSFFSHKRGAESILCFVRTLPLNEDSFRVVWQGRRRPVRPRAFMVRRVLVRSAAQNSGLSYLLRKLIERIKKKLQSSQTEVESVAVTEVSSSLFNAAQLVALFKESPTISNLRTLLGAPGHRALLLQDTRVFDQFLVEIMKLEDSKIEAFKVMAIKHDDLRRGVKAMFSDSDRVQNFLIAINMHDPHGNCRLLLGLARQGLKLPWGLSSFSLGTDLEMIFFETYEKQLSDLTAIVAKVSASPNLQKNFEETCNKILFPKDKHKLLDDFVIVFFKALPENFRRDYGQKLQAQYDALGPEDLTRDQLGLFFTRVDWPGDSPSTKLATALRS